MIKFPKIDGVDIFTTTKEETLPLIISNCKKDVHDDKRRVNCICYINIRPWGLYLIMFNKRSSINHADF